MHALPGARERLFAAALVLVAAVCGLILAEQTPRGLLLVGVCAVAAFGVVTFEAPVVALAGLALLLGAASEEPTDDRLLGVTSHAYDRLVSYVNPPVLLLGLAAVVLALTFTSKAPMWPGAPASLALSLLAVATASLAARGQLGHGLIVLRPLVILVLAILVGYWLALRYGIEVPLKALVYAAMLVIPIGLYNVAAGDLSFYDSSVVYLLGLAAVLVLFRAVDIGFARVPFLVLSAPVIVLSFRRGAMLGIAITLVITGLLAGRGTFRAVIAIAAGAVVGAELVAPGIVLGHVDHVVGYFTGASGQDYAVNYRHYETANAVLNVKAHWLWGLGPITNWTLYRTFDGSFVPVNQDYLHNSYLWVWLRYGLAGLLVYSAFLLACAFTLVRRSAPIAALVIGASSVGLIASLVTASFLTTTNRWPLTVGLVVGVGLAALRMTPRRSDGARAHPEPPARPSARVAFRN